MMHRITPIKFTEKNHEIHYRLTGLFQQIEEIVSSEIISTSARHRFFDAYEVAHMWLGKAIRQHQLTNQMRDEDPVRWAVMQERKEYAKKSVEKAIEEKKNPTKKPHEFKKSVLDRTGDARIVARRGEISVKGRAVVVERKKV
jgi:hypothetical protein